MTFGETDEAALTHGSDALGRLTDYCAGRNRKAQDKAQERRSVMTSVLLAFGEVFLFVALTWLLWTPAKLAWTRSLRSPGQYAAVVAWIIVGGILWFLWFGHLRTGRWLWE